MQYRYAARENFEDLAAGRVLRGAPGATNFPVRLASELFQRAVAALPDGGGASLHLWDPCCGSGYLLTVLGFLHHARIARLTGSDVDPEILRVARENLDLLDAAGLDRREAELRQLAERFGKQSHEEALRALARLRAVIEAGGGQPPERVVFEADATNRDELRAGLAGAQPDVVVTDVPYGRLKAWTTPEAGDEPAVALLDAMHDLLAPGAVAAVVTPKRVRPSHGGYRLLERLSAGKREAHLFARL